MNAAEKNKSIYPDAIAPKINFELINKSDSSIAVNIDRLKRIGGYYIIQSSTLESNPTSIGSGFVEIKPQNTFAAQIDLGKPTDIQIASRVAITAATNKPYPSAVEKYSIDAPGKTRYFSYNSSKAEGERLYPQTGPLKGLGKLTPNFIMEDRTNSGLLKRNNVEVKDIAVLK